jgi:ASC-1-like (ASCH) protein
MSNKKLSFFSVCAIFGIGLFFTTQANAVKEEVRQNRQEAIQNAKEIRNEIRETNKENIASRVGALKNFFSFRAMLNKAKVTAKSTNSLIVEKDSVSYTITVDDKTKIRRRFYGKATLEDILVGHEVNVFGKWTDTDHKTIQALLIRDLSIQKRFGVFIGDVTAISGNDITLQTIQRGVQKVSVSALTKFVNRKMETIKQTDIIIGHRIRVKGMWDRTLNTVTEVTQVKDYNLPPKATGTPKPLTPTPTVTPLLTPTATPTASPMVTVTATPTPPAGGTPTP